MEKQLNTKNIHHRILRAYAEEFKDKDYSRMTIVMCTLLEKLSHICLYHPAHIEFLLLTGLALDAPTDLKKVMQILQKDITAFNQVFQNPIVMEAYTHETDLEPFD